MQIDKIIRSNRKSIAIVVEKDGSLIIRAPKKASLRQINQLVRENISWIKRTQQEARSKYRPSRPRQYLEGEVFQYLGNQYPLLYVDRTRPKLTLKRSFELSKTNQNQAESLFIEWYRKQAKIVFRDRANHLSSKFGLKYKGIRVTSAQKRWGSCNSRGGLNFPWRLVMAPLSVIDYVVLHELVHTEINNHSKIFWARIKSLMPDYKDQVKWLKEYGFYLSLDIH